MLQIPSSKSSTIATWRGEKGNDNEAWQGKEWDRYQSWQGHGLGQDPREEDEWFLEQKKFEQKRVDQRRREQNAVRAPGDSYCCCCCSSLLKLWGNFNFQTSLPLFQQITSWSIFQLDFFRTQVRSLLPLSLTHLSRLDWCDLKKFLWYSGTQLSGPLCLWQCFQYDTTLLKMW